ncbi:hypothetical protein L873DRAFT_757838 [Choiromyces venosus 120613-1]|uniref:Secreted protein n=1 Tax=Choiromyces venosus 120613-1 TaxID=1336337 RepID=A0A3N4JUW6_9PEZI|nr:hypothetical protein L873DRAFT_757838 [Choiromyces venosus 120613-1]
MRDVYPPFLRRLSVCLSVCLAGTQARTLQGEHNYSTKTGITVSSCLSCRITRNLILLAAGAYGSRGVGWTRWGREKMAAGGSGGCGSVVTVFSRAITSLQPSRDCTSRDFFPQSQFSQSDQGLISQESRDAISSGV